MPVKLQLSPDLEAKLGAQARARGLSLEAYLEQLLRERSHVQTAPSVDPAERARSFETWAHSHPLTPPLLDDAVRRQSLVRDAQ